MNRSGEPKEKIRLSDHFTYGRLIRFTLPAISSMMFSSVYGVVDGIFVSNFTGGIPFAALNLIIPYVMFFVSLAYMLGNGGCALVAFTLGRGEKKKANELFSLIVYSTVAAGIAFSVFGFLTTGTAAGILGADSDMMPYCITYARINFIGLVPFMLQIVFQSFLVTAEKPKLAFGTTVAAGITNMVLHAVLVWLLGLGIVGAAWSTVISQIVGCAIPLAYFIAPNSSLLRLGGTRWYGREMLKTATNGSSEFLSNVSISLVNMLYNYQLMIYAGRQGVAAYGIIMYTNFVFVGSFYGYSVGSAPVIAYDHGAENRPELKNVFTKSLKMIGIAGTCATVSSVLLAPVLSLIFSGGDASLYAMTENAIRIYSFNYLFIGFNIFASAFFTALNNGGISALISVLRTLVFQIAAVMLLPLVFAINGIWMSIVAAELCAIMVSAACVILLRKRYGYL